MRLALIGDIHLFRLKVRPGQLFGKRLLGQSNLWLNRRFRFNHEMLEPIIRRIASVEPAHVLCTGDVTTTSLEDEFTDIVRYLRPLSDKMPLTVVPGNHDRYTFRSARKRRIETLLEGLMPAKFPHHEKLNERWHLLALDSARPQIMMSRGFLGLRQLVGIRRTLSKLTEEEGVVVLCHYPPDVPPGTPRSWAHELADSSLLLRAMQGCKARVVFIHGHIHRPWHWEKANGANQWFTYINAGAPCMTSVHYPFGQGFWEVILPDDPMRDLGLIHHVPTPEGHYNVRAPRPAAATATERWHARQVL